MSGKAFKQFLEQSMMKQWILAVGAVLLLSACATQNAPQPTASANNTPMATRNPNANSFDLKNSEWTLSAFEQTGKTQPVAGGTPLTLNFSDNQNVNGKGGCNAFSGTYKTQGEIIQFEALASTERACADANLMQQESAYLQALQNAQRFQVQGSELKITYSNGQGQLVFQRAP
jgi:heat shock protein HslJ